MDEDDDEEDLYATVENTGWNQSQELAQQASSTEGFPALGDAEAAAVAGAKRQRISIPRAKSAKGTAEALAPAKAGQEVIEVRNVPLQIASFGGNSDCGYVVLACMRAISSGKKVASYPQGDDGRGGHEVGSYAASEGW
eukprot:14588668-Alexandrium_andersonii.AAC.1